MSVRTEMFWGAFGKQRESKLMWRRVADCSRHDFLRPEKHGRRRWQVVFVGPLTTMMMTNWGNVGWTRTMEPPHCRLNAWISNLLSTLEVSNTNIQPSPTNSTSGGRRKYFDRVAQRRNSCISFKSITVRCISLGAGSQLLTIYICWVRYRKGPLLPCNV